MNFSIGQKFVAQKEFGKALEVFTNLRKKENNNDEVLFYLGLIYFELNNYDKSIYYYEKFLKKKPNSILALYNLAFVKQSIGQIESAKNIYLKLIKIDKNKIRPYYGLFTLNPKNLDDEKFDIILKIKDNSRHSLFEEGIINYLLSKKEKLKNNYLEEIEYLKKSHNFIYESKKKYNVSSQFYLNEIQSKFCNKIKFINTKFINKEIIPIFIIGLPRSGSTLIEAILGSGLENVNSLGECHVINTSILEQIGSKIYAKDFDIKTFNFELDQRIFYESVLRKYDHFNYSNKVNNKILIDKSLENFFNIEAIIKIFPKAKFIHSFRNPYDSIISIYQSMLSELPWTHSIEDIIRYINNYLIIISHFKKKYPEAIIDINLEELTNNSENISKDIYRFCGFKWNEDALNFYKRDNLHSKTLSFAQIRNKVSKYNTKKYQPYFHLIKKYKESFNWLKHNSIE